MSIKDSRISARVRGVNANTRFAGISPPPSLDTDALRDAYRIVENVSRAMRPMDVPGYRLFWVHGTSFGSIEIPAVEGVYKVVGRHSRCDVVLGEDPEIALRHLLIRAVTMPGDGVALRMLDLHTSLGFHLGEDEPARSMFARGPVSLRVGRYALVAMPSGGGDAPVDFSPPLIEHAQGSPYRSASPRPRAVTHITIYPGAPMVDELLARASSTARITFRRGQRSHTIDLGDAELERGILIGRADKCNRTMAVMLGGSISRVHLLILREENGLFVFDLASTHGTFARGQRVRRFRLPNHPETIVLGANEVALHWHG
ncbi:MAG: FHA domain-containing protein [Polyangiaceae bacterium]